jgi:hypothetical protein
MKADDFAIDNLPRPAAVVAEVVAEAAAEAVAAALVTPEVVAQEACPACVRGDSPHRDGYGRPRPGHAIKAKGRKNRATRLALAAMRSNVVKAAQILVKALDDPNPWVRMQAVRMIIERVMPPAEATRRGDFGTVLVFPPGTKMEVLPARLERQGIE